VSLKTTWKLMPVLLLAVGSGAAADRAGSSDHSADVAAIEKALNDGCEAVVRADPDAMIAPFTKSKDMVMFDFSPPRLKNYAGLRAANEEFVKAIDGKGYCKYLEIHASFLGKDAAYTWAILSAGGKLKTGQMLNLTIRSTDVWKKQDGRWQIVHEHNSFPVDPFTGAADLKSDP